MRAAATVLVWVWIATAATAAAAEMQREDVPDALRPWMEWALHGAEEATCAALFGEAERHQCSWPARLGLDLDERGGSFEQEWDTQRDTWVPLPGASTRWPQRVTVDAEPAAVIDRDGTPQVWLRAGRHLVSGRFIWDRLPEMLTIPPATGILSLIVRQQEVPFPQRDRQGRLWLQRRADVAGENEDDRVAVIVHRLVDDDLPLLLDTRLQIDVSGKAREVVLGPVLPDGVVPMALDSPLPARFEADGRLRLQVRAGRWSLRALARHDGPVVTLVAPQPTETWAEREIWVFRAHPDLRLVSIEEADAIDPQQTDLPGDWRALPAYLMRPGAVMRLAERRRGDTDTAPDQLALSRTLWLDFDGGGYTLHDNISGTMTRAWRLDMAAPTQLGRVAINGADQFITRLAAEKPAGVEIRAGTLQLDADSRLERGGGTLPAVGWLHDFQSVSAQLQMPPGWRLLYATGVDRANPTWVTRWTLLDLFIVLIASLATARLFGWGWGLTALLALVLTYTEPEAPTAVWIAVLAAEGLCRVVPAGRARRALLVLRALALAALFVAAIPFLVGRLRQGLYPALEQPHSSIDVAQRPAAAPPPATKERLSALGYVEDAVAPPPGPTRSFLGSDNYQTAEIVDEENLAYRAIDPDSIVQTGPGLPSWSWTTAVLDWSGPVDRDQRLRLFLLSPEANLALAVAQTLLLALLLGRFAGLALGRRQAAAASVALALFAVVPARAEFPSDALLQELRSRLLEPPDCHPSCAALTRMLLEADAGSLHADLQLDVAAPAAVPLPGQISNWMPRAVEIDGQPAPALMLGQDGILWVRLEPGIHRVAIDGPLPPRDTVMIVLPMLPRRIETKIGDWQLNGVHDDGSTDPTLQLSRRKHAEGAEALQANQLPPFARVERTLHLGLTWQMSTRIVRLSPADTAMVMDVPLLPGEAVTSADVRVRDGRAQINLSPGVGVQEWQSNLAERSPIELHAPQGVPWVEVWRLDASSIWHVDPTGIAPVLPKYPGASSLREWRPWPGESVTLEVIRPQGIPGQTLTVDGSILRIVPGARSTEASLSLDMRSSRGAQHAVRLPAGAELLSAMIGGTLQPVRLEGRDLVLPINPGPQHVEIQWRQAGGIASRFRVPAVDLATASVNAQVEVTMPPSRWILFTSGPRLGPAVLFWSQLPLLLLIAAALGRVRTTPLRARHWLLLGIGLTQVPIAAALIVVGWLFAVGWRRERGADLSTSSFDLVQVLLIAWTLVALGTLFFAIQQGLLGEPRMQIAGNGSSLAVLRWYQDRSAAILPRPWVISVPLLAYRLLMLAWALWIAAALLGWLRWAWECFATGGSWRPLRKAPSTPATP